MTDFVVKMLGLLTGWIGKLPDLSVEGGVLSSMAGSMDLVLGFLSQVNFIVPLDQIVMIMGIVYAFKAGKLLLFVMNWIIRRLADFFP